MNRSLPSIVMVLCIAICAAAQWKQILPSETVSLRDPRSLSISAEGLLYIADTGHHRIVVVDTAGDLVLETGGFGTAHGQFQWPRSVVADRGNSIWVLDYGNRRIEKFSRLLAYQGSLEIFAPGSQQLGQPEAIAVSPQGDLFVFERDSGNLLRYDPLFNVQARTGQGGGAAFISNVASMTFVPKKGLFWWERGGKEIRSADALLNASSSLPVRASAQNVVLTSLDTCLIAGLDNDPFRLCSILSQPDSLLTAQTTREMNLKRIAAVCADRSFLFILDDRAGTVFRIDLPVE